MTAEHTPAASPEDVQALNELAEMKQSDEDLAVLMEWKKELNTPGNHDEPGHEELPAPVNEESIKETEEHNLGAVATSKNVLVITDNSSDKQPFEVKKVTHLKTVMPRASRHPQAFNRHRGVRHTSGNVNQSGIASHR